jgi:hypothetical protein
VVVLLLGSEFVVSERRAVLQSRPSSRRYMYICVLFVCGFFFRLVVPCTNNNTHDIVLNEITKQTAIAASSEWQERLTTMSPYELLRSMHARLTSFASWFVTSSSSSSPSSAASHASMTPSSSSVESIVESLQNFRHFLRTEVNWIHTPLLLG